MALDPRVRGTLRHRLSHLLRAEGGFVTARNDAAEVLLPRADAEMLLPAVVGDYTDFYASLFHATNVGQMLRPDNPLLPNYKWVPIGYHGRASSLVVSGTAIARPAGPDRAGRGRRAALRPDPLARLRARGRRVSRPRQPARRRRSRIAEAESHLFGLCLLNDWSARDVQKWEYQPLGPFLAKSFATSISPWVVTLEALAPYRAPAFARARGRPAAAPLPLARGRPRARRHRPQARGAARHEGDARARACRRSGSATATCATSTGRSRRWSRTTARTAATCGPGT